MKILVILAIGLTTVSAELTCIKNEEDTICSADEEFSVLQRGSVSDDENTLLVSVANCKLTDIETDAFDNLPNVERLDLSLNVLTSIQPAVFSNLYTVRELNLSHNLINELSEGLFNPFVYLNVIDLSHNKILQLSSTLFNENAALNKILLSHNQITDLPLELFDKTLGVTYLDLSYNPLTIPVGVFDFMKNLNTLKLESTQFSTILTEVFTENGDIAKLYLSGNKISEIPEGFFTALPKLTYLDLSNNLITGLGENTFRLLDGLKTLNLSRNQLTDIEELTLLPQLTTLNVSGNLLNTFPAFTALTLRTIDISANRFTHTATLNQALPRRLTTLILHRNPWQCACLELLITLLQRRKINYKSNLYFNGKRPICVQSREKVQRCFRDNTRDEYFISTYASGLAKYKIL